MSCNGLCSRVAIRIRPKGGFYIEGYKRCNICEVFLKIDGLYCPCCRMRLRSLPRGAKYKNRVREFRTRLAICQLHTISTFNTLDAYINADIAPESIPVEQNIVMIHSQVRTVPIVHTGVGT